MKVNSKLVFGLLAGAAIGAVAGILLAPEKGADTRKKIADGVGEAGDNLKDRFNDFVDGVKDKYLNAKSEADDVAHDVAKMGTPSYKSFSSRAKDALS